MIFTLWSSFGRVMSYFSCSALYKAIYLRVLLYGCGRHSNASLTCFANAFYIVIGKPFDFGFEQCFFYVLELGLTDNNFNFFIVVFVFCI